MKGNREKTILYCSQCPANMRTSNPRPTYDKNEKPFFRSNLTSGLKMNHAVSNLFNSIKMK